MTEVSFYHCTRTAPDATLPRLLDRVLASGERAVVLCGSPERVAALDALLWEAGDWLPHGATDDADLQPVWLTATPANPNGAAMLFLIDGAQADPSGYARAFDLFDGNDPAQVAAARARWTQVKAAGHTPVYWQQAARGWERK